MIINIQLQENFIETLILWSQATFKDEFFKLKIFFPNHRCCQKFQETLRNSLYQGVSPKVKAIADLQIDDFYEFLPNFEVEDFIIQATRIKVLSDVESLFFLTSKLMNLAIFGKLNFERAFKIAIDIKELLDDIENNDIELANLSKIDDSNLALHRQIGLDFLKDFYLNIKNSLLSEGLMLNSSFQNFLSKNFCKFITEFGLKQPIIVAGSTGSMAISRNLMKATLNQNNSHIVLFGLEPQDVQKDSVILKNDSLKQSHPQFLLHRLLKHLGCKPYEVQNFSTKNSQNSQNFDYKNRLISLLFNPNLWQNAAEILKQKNDFDLLNYGLDDNLKIPELIIAKNEFQEAKIITNLIEKTRNESCNSRLRKKNQELKIGIICNSDLLKKLLRSSFGQQKILYNDSSSQNFFGNELGNFLLLIFEIAHEEFNAHSLLALVKNRYFLIEKDAKIISDFEIEILRQDLSFKSLTSLLEQISNQDFKNFLDNIITALPTDKSLLSLIHSLEKFSCANFSKILAKNSAKEEVSQFFKKLLACDYHPSSSSELGFIFSQITFFEKNFKQPETNRVEILSPIEARLLKFDLLFVCGLTENNFPKIAKEDWIGIKTRQSLGIAKSAIKIGQNNFDFCNFLSSKKVILSYAIQHKSLEQKPSPLITKLTTLCKKANIKITLESELLQDKQVGSLISEGTPGKPKFFEEFLDSQICEKASVARSTRSRTNLDNRHKSVSDCNRLKKLKNFANKITKKDGFSEVPEAPNPKPPLTLRPNSYSITEISELINNPYALYVKKVLQLKELKKIEYESGSAEFGSFVHKALEIFTSLENKSSFNAKIFDKIFSKFFASPEAKLIWLPKFNKIFADFLLVNEQFLTKKSLVEYPVALHFEGLGRKILLKGRIDRIVVETDGSFAIFDYKTGSLPSSKEVTSGLQPQLTILAYILATLQNLHNPDFERISSINYWQLSKSKGSIIKNLFEKREDLSAAISAVLEGLNRIFSYFENENNGFFAGSDLQKDRIKNLSRIKEWTA